MRLSRWAVSVKREAGVMCLYRYAAPIIRHVTGDLVAVGDDKCWERIGFA